MHVNFKCPRNEPTLFWGEGGAYMYQPWKGRAEVVAIVEESCFLSVFSEFPKDF